MSKPRPTPRKPEPEGEPAVVVSVPEPARSAAEAEAYVVVSHESLFEAASPSSFCDACGEGLPDEDIEEGYGVRGQGVYHWVRGDEQRLEKVPLCSSCAAAIGMTALARWEIEEEEG
jgi:hypothetical protein